MWELDFITKDELIYHVKETISKYGDKLKAYDLKKFNSNIIDPIKMIFDKNVYQTSWEEIINNEIFRQRDKSNSNDIGYFHQNIFQYMKNCVVPKQGWDVIYHVESGISILDIGTVNKEYVEMKNKHNTMNSASSAKTFIKMQAQLLEDDDCACYLVEAIAKKSQNIKWEPKVDGKKMGHKLIRRVSMDQFYSLVTGDDLAFYKLCQVLPDIIAEVLNQSDGVAIPNDTVFEELQKVSKEKNIPFVLAIYMLGFENYQGFQ